MSERGFLSAALIQLIIYAAIAAAVVAAVYWVYSSIKGIGYRDAVAVWQPKYEALDKQFNDFTAGVKAQGEAQEAEKTRKEKADREYIASRTKPLEEQIARLRADNADLSDRVRQHFAGQDPGRGGLPGLPGVPGGSGPGATDDVSALRFALEGLARDAAETTVMFNECRLRWKEIASR